MRTDYHECIGVKMLPRLDSDYSVVKTCQNTEKSPGDLRETCCHSDFCESPAANTDVKNSQGVKK